MTLADVNAVTPSTNDINRTNGWAHVNQLSKGIGTTELEFVSSRNFYSCFEYRTDGDTSQIESSIHGGVNFNSDITDGLYPYVCKYNSRETLTIQANEYVEVRMVFGGETDERFDWTRFDVLYNRTAEITSPDENEVVSGLVSFDAVLNDKDGDDSVQWAVRKGTCAAGTNTVFGNVDGYSDVYAWDHTNFHATADTTTWDDGDYCFIFNPTESTGDAPIRETQEFVVDNTNPDTVEGITIWQNGVNIGCGATVRERGIKVDWDDSTDPNFSYYRYQADDGEGAIDYTTTLVPSERSGDIRDLDGTYMYRVQAVDSVGNTGEYSNWCSVTLDRVLDTKDECKNDGWKNWSDLSFKNQGDCVSWLMSNENAKGNRKGQ